ETIPASTTIPASGGSATHGGTPPARPTGTRNPRPADAASPPPQAARHTRPYTGRRFSGRRRPCLPVPPALPILDPKPMPPERLVFDRLRVREQRRDPLPQRPSLRPVEERFRYPQPGNRGVGLLSVPQDVDHRRLIVRQGRR